MQGQAATHGSRGLYALFLLTFPGYFIYHYLVTVQWLPPFLAGYSTPVGLLSLPFLLAIHMREVLNRPVTALPVIERWLWVFLLYYGIVVMWELATRNMLNSADVHPTVIAQFAALFLLALHTPMRLEQSRLLTVLVLVMSLMNVHNAFNGGLLDATLAVTFGITNSKISYQGYAFAYFVTLASLIPLLHSRPWWRLALYAIACVALFLNGARSEFAVAIVAFAALEFIRSQSKWRAVRAALAIVLVFVALYFIFEDEVRDYRVITIFTDFDEDISVQDRRRMFADGMATILNHPMTGRLGSYLDGEYIHGFLSAWVDLGAGGFALFAVLSLLPVAHLVINRRKIAADPLLQQAFLFTASSLMLSLTAKPFSQYLLPLALGLCARHMALNDDGSRRTASQRLFAS